MVISVALLHVSHREAPVSLWVLEKENTIKSQYYETARGLEGSGFALHIMVMHLFEMKTFRDYAL